MKKVITYGTFDLFHEGHRNILKRAKAQGDYLIVGVTSESYDIERGKLNVKDSLTTRIKNVRDTGFADEIIIEEYQGQKINDIITHDVNILVIGSDWLGKFDYLKEYCEVLYLERTKGISSTMVRETTRRVFKIGVATDNLDDNSLVDECRYISGAHVEGVYSPSHDVADKFRRTYQLDLATDDYSAFLEAMDIVYIKTGVESRAALIEEAIDKGVHVVTKSPFALDEGESERLFTLARDHGVTLIEDVNLAYLRAFTQLVWFVQGGIIGDLHRINLGAHVDGNPDSGAYRDRVLFQAIFAAQRILKASDPQTVESVTVVDEADAITDEVILLGFENRFASLSLSSSESQRNFLTIYGSTGVVRVPEEWWNIGYFRVETHDTKQQKHYSFNFEGTGMRYLLQELFTALEENRLITARFSLIDSLAVMRTMARIAAR